jgi:uncharacterized membrane protein
MLKIEFGYWLVGAFLLVAAGMNLRERRWSMGLFWGILAIAFIAGDAILAALAAGSRWPAQAMGAGVIALGVLAAAGSTSNAAEPAEVIELRRSESLRLGNRLFLPALAIPLVTLLLVLAAPYARWQSTPLLDPPRASLLALVLACVAAFAYALRVTRATPATGVAEGRRLLDALSWAVLLPMLLATLGSVFAATGVGDAIASLVAAVIPIDDRLACLLAFALGMVLFTVIMGNAFAAFPVMMAGIGLPLLVLRHGAHPAILGALGMLTGYCGTLLTPMAANFNIVPAVLLELRDTNAVIRAQVPTALALLLFNVALMAMLVFR